MGVEPKLIETRSDLFTKSPVEFGKELPKSMRVETLNRTECSIASNTDPIKR